MAGTILGPDQVRKLNAAYPALVAHIRGLLVSDHSGVGLMKVHSMVESFDSDEMAKIFRELSFIMPRERLALVRAAIYEIHAKEPALFISPEVTTPVTVIGIDPAEPGKDKTVVGVFSPPQFKLNVNKAENFHGQAPADTPPPAPVVTSTHRSTIAKNVDEGNKRMAEQQLKIDAAVAKFRETTAPRPIEIPAVPEDATLPQVEE